jgi:hypothetical protein
MAGESRIVHFRQELEGLINKCSLENGSDTPDFILAQYLVDCLRAYDTATQRRAEWYGQPLPGHPLPPITLNVCAPDADVLRSFLNGGSANEPR